MLDTIFTMLDQMFEKAVYVWSNIPVFMDSVKNYITNQYNLLYNDNIALLFVIMFIGVILAITGTYIVFSFIYKKLFVNNNRHYKKYYKRNNNVSNNKAFNDDNNVNYGNKCRNDDFFTCPSYSFMAGNMFHHATEKTDSNININNNHFDVNDWSKI